ncbi:Transthyretin-like family protein [Aphelenchoides besseyi]|nr:Transthyretin-like family protein [Aphelenchoides besseyi]
MRYFLILLVFGLAAVEGMRKQGIAAKGRLLCGALPAASNTTKTDIDPVAIIWHECMDEATPCSRKEKYVPPRVLWPIQFTIGYFIFHFYLFKAISLPIVFEMIELFKWIAQIQLQLKFHAFIQFIGYKITGFVNVLKSLVVGLKNEMLRIVAKVKLSRKPMELKKPVYEDELNEEECSEA